MPKGCIEPCPHCGKKHEVGEYIPRPDLKKPDSKGIPWNAPDVKCECGALLRATVPIFKVTGSGYVWRRVDEPAKV